MQVEGCLGNKMTCCHFVCCLFVVLCCVVVFGGQEKIKHVWLSYFGA